MKANRSVLVVYENLDSRKAAVGFCDRLMQRFWSEAGFDVTWWPFDTLRELHAARDAAEKAAEADWVVCAAESGGEMPFHVRAWVERWLSRRGEREGTLVGLTGASPLGSDKHQYLRQIAHRAGMDYLTEIPQNLSLAIPDSPESYAARAEQVSSVLEEILHSPRQPTTPRS